MKMTRIMAAATAILVGSLAVAAAQEQVKVATFVPEQSTGVAGVIKPWMDAVQADVGGAVKMQGFWGGTLGKSPVKQFELVQNGVADITWVLPSYTAGQFPEMSLFELPFLFRTADEASIVGWKLHEAGLLTGFDGVHVIGIFATEPNALFMEEPIAGLEDLDGKKIRSAGAIQAKWLEAFGASPQALSSAEYNEALNRGTIDGVIQGWTGMNTFKSFPLVSQAVDVPAGTIPFLLLMNEAKWDSLPPEVQESMMTHGGLAMAESGAAAYTAAGEKVVEEQKAEGRLEILIPDADKLAAHEETTQAVHQWWIERTDNGQEIFDQTQAILAGLRGES
ncbi:hypothetical protein GE300_15050 [Rhodobacteraceae bacterium 2CG4]|uniref:TRAP-type C4-dicarboxylate transport system substrate-binding protein n=1 Tax=Halovulum marinum TaxID=2662447 RepID=A0A6L5Z496_9RHOB|nr:TRAP transporter substrate-binding protein [Halovulum marinum]MSU90915.1 hypothetical protein [Halovulum marinum]